MQCTCLILYLRNSLILFIYDIVMGNILPIISGRMGLAMPLGNIFPSEEETSQGNGGEGNYGEAMNSGAAIRGFMSAR